MFFSLMTTNSVDHDLTSQNMVSAGLKISDFLWDILTEKILQVFFLRTIYMIYFVFFELNKCSQSRRQKNKSITQVFSEWSMKFKREMWKPLTDSNETGNYWWCVKKKKKQYITSCDGRG